MSFLDDELLKGTGVALMKVKIKSGCEGVMVRSVVFGISLMAMYMPGAQADQARYKSEIERLDDVRRVVAGENIEDFKSVFSTAIKGPVELCNAMVSDLLNGKKFTAIEPSIVFDQEFPEGAKQGGAYQSQQKMDADKALGKETSDGIAQCRGADAEGSEDRARVLFSGAGYESGQPPYRIYRLSDKVNPVSTTNIVFWSEFDQHLGRGRDGYLWVDLQKCEYVKGVGVMTSSESLKNDPSGQVAALTTYSEVEGVGQGLAVWKASRGLRLELELHKLSGGNVQSGKEEVINCVWDTYKRKGVSHVN